MLSFFDLRITNLTDLGRNLMDQKIKNLSRRSVLKRGAGAAILGGVAPFAFVRNAHAYTNAPTGGSVKFGFNVPQSGAYADEGADELRAQGVQIRQPVVFLAQAQLVHICADAGRN